MSASVSCSPCVGLLRPIPPDATHGDFTPPRPVKSPKAGVGPSANRGQKSSMAGFALGIDYLTLIFKVERLDYCGMSKDMRFLLPFIFGGKAMLTWGGWTGKRYQFYSDSSLIWDREGQLVGRIAVGGNKDTMLVELSGAGCRWVKNWRYVREQAELLEARISRCDVALDDFDGQLFTVRGADADARAGLFAGSGRPPKSRFLDDHGNGTGCTLYVGKKGHKELCVYEKGKQCGDELSPWVRAEVRLYGKHYGEAVNSGRVVRSLPLDILTDPAQYFRGAYERLAVLTANLALAAGQRLKVVKAKVDATVKSAVSWLNTQCGPTLHLLHAVLGDDFAEFLRQHVSRNSPPSRFRALGAGDHLHDLLRVQICQQFA